MNKKISILGCGWLGLALAIDLIGEGYDVNGSTTSKHKMKAFAEKHIKPFLIDISNTDNEMREFLICDVLIIAITSKSISDIKVLISHIEASGVSKVIFISSTSVYPFTNGIVTEATGTSQTPLAEIEKLFINNTTFKSTIIRFGGLFGYDRNPANFIKPGKPIEHPEGYINFIHRDDCIAIIKHILLKDVWNDILNACTDDHPKRRAFYLKVTANAKQKSVVFNENSENEYKIISSEKLKRLLGYEFIHADLMNIV